MLKKFFKRWLQTLVLDILIEALNDAKSPEHKLIQTMIEDNVLATLRRDRSYLDDQIQLIELSRSWDRVEHGIQRLRGAH